MGRGRAKAKQTKVARELKYGGPQTDFDRLQAELGGSSSTYSSTTVEADEVEEDDPYAKYLDDDEK
jgi:hypothetical protein